MAASTNRPNSRARLPEIPSRGADNPVLNLIVHCRQTSLQKSVRRLCMMRGDKADGTGVGHECRWRVDNVGAAVAIARGGESRRQVIAQESNIGGARAVGHSERAAATVARI